MKIRCDLNVNGGRRRVVIQPQVQESLDTLALKLAAYILFWDLEPTLDLSPKDPALQGQPFLPDLASLDPSGAIALWVECGKVALYKLDKLSRRFPHAKLVVLKASEAEGLRLRADMDKELDRGHLIEVWAWPAADFKVWKQSLTDDLHVVGEAAESSLNLVVNETPLFVDLLKF